MSKFNTTPRAVGVVGYASPSNPAMGALMTWVEAQDRALLATYPAGFVRFTVPGEFYPNVLPDCLTVCVQYQGEQVRRYPVERSGAALGWAESAENSGKTIDADEWNYGQEFVLFFAGQPDPRTAPTNVREARRRAYNFQEPFFGYAAGYAPIPKRLAKPWRTALFLADENEGEEEAG